VVRRAIADKLARLRSRCQLLARMTRFVIADISDAKSVLQELRAVMPELPSVPVQPVIIASQEGNHPPRTAAGGDHAATA
jgi:hypothetical protein